MQTNSTAAQSTVASADDPASVRGRSRSVTVGHGRFHGSDSWQAAWKLALKIISKVIIKDPRYNGETP